MHDQYYNCSSDPLLLSSSSVFCKHLCKNLSKHEAPFSVCISHSGIVVLKARVAQC